jgi:hypothetical protein
MVARQAASAGPSETTMKFTAVICLLLGGILGGYSAKCHAAG